MKHRMAGFVTGLMLIGSNAAPAAETLPGKLLFNRWCAECHAAGHGHPGTQQLGLLRGEKLALLEQRRDLNAGLIKYVVRHGQNAMPPYRPSEISDAELQQLGEYLAPTGKRAAR